MIELSLERQLKSNEAKFISPQPKANMLVNSVIIFPLIFPMIQSDIRSKLFEIHKLSNRNFLPRHDILDSSEREETFPK